MISASHALGYYRGVLGNSSIEPKAPVPVRGAFACARGAWGGANKGGKCGVGLLVMTPQQPLRRGKPRPAGSSPRAGRGAYAIRALPDLCLGIGSGRLEAHSL